MQKQIMLRRYLESCNNNNGTRHGSSKHDYAAPCRPGASFYPRRARTTSSHPPSQQSVACGRHDTIVAYAPSMRPFAVPLPPSIGIGSLGHLCGMAGAKPGGGRHMGCFVFQPQPLLVPWPVLQYLAQRGTGKGRKFLLCRLTGRAKRFRGPP